MADLLSMNHYRVRDWTGGPFMERCILLQIVNTVQSFPSVISMVIFLSLYLRLILKLCATSTGFHAKVMSCKSSEK
jgi:hypothetical protein